MMALLKWGLALLAGLVIFLGVLYYLPDGQARRLVAGMKSQVEGRAAQPMTQASYQGLPAPVAAWLARAAPEGSAEIVFARIRHAGSLRPEGSDRWLAMSGLEWFTARPPSFVWSARVWLLPLMWMQARDYYRAGQGEFHGALFGLVPLVSGAGPETDQASLLRWLAESVWVPTALTAGGPVAWQPQGPRAARATVRHHGLSASGVFRFGEDGLPTGFTADRRMRQLPSGPVFQPWQASYHGWRRFGDYLLPEQAEVAWLEEPGPRAYARYVVLEAAFNSQALRAEGPLP
jgi:hypothetical protein